MKVWKIAALLFVCRGAAWAASIPKPSTGPTSAEQYLFAAANAQREHLGLQPLHWDTALYQAAEYHAEQMVERGSISHQYEGEPDPTARGAAVGARFSLIEENVAEANSPTMIQLGWMLSPGHRENMLNPQVDSVAIRVVKGSDGELYAVEDLGRSVREMSLSQQEEQVERVLESKSGVHVMRQTAAARRTCAMNSGYAGRKAPDYVVWYNSADLSVLPRELQQRLVTGRYREAAVGACPAEDREGFTEYNVAVLLYR
ncbi:MAG: CAP domain-containing protein [Acidobacteriaceae bacterium]